MAVGRGWLALIDGGHYAESWRQASAYFQGMVTEPQWTGSLDGGRRPLGNLIARHLKKATPPSSLPGAPDGGYVVMEFETSFANKQHAVETVTFALDRDGTWRAAGYYIR
ncbi:MAG TPA: DUF4019 domain-containing protein [Candidatus Limnocylindrales bacterium]|nr:DUF4019 domain-containing protein [Candidatus Limnocylindrales bacterium]